MTAVADKPNLAVNEDDVKRQLRLMFKKDDVIELRAVGVSRGSYRPNVESGYFDNLQDAQAAINKITPYASATYFTLNPVHPDLLSRRSNRMDVAGNGETTSDVQIPLRRHLLIDVDPDRIAKISSTDEEHEAALVLTGEIREALTALGWPIPIYGDSGNGGHLIYAIDEPVADDELVKNVLNALDTQFSTADIKVDTGNFNPARISKVYGTPVRKGDDTTTRPHRVSSIIEAPEKLEPVLHELLAALAAKAPSPTEPERRNSALPTGDILDVQRFLADAGVGVRSEIPAGDGTRYRLDACPRCSSKDGNPWLWQHPAGGLTAGCFESDCGLDWKWLREQFSDAYANQLSPSTNRSTNKTNELPISSFISYPYSREWPAPLRPEAFHGPMGELIQLQELHSESDPAALLAQGLLMFGGAVGHKPHWKVEKTNHHMNEFVLIVGKTARGRKGSSLDRQRDIFKSVDEEWEKTRIVSGLASGEGLIHAVRDPVEKDVEEKDTNGEPTGRWKKVVVDPGVTDKRLLDIEPEFGAILKLSVREGNITSQRLRDGWDGHVMENLNKNTPEKATDPHISQIGHITQEELTKNLTSTERASGFANRYLFLCVERKRVLPRGGQDHEDYGPLVNQLKAALEFGRSVGELDMTNAAWALWDDAGLYAYVGREIPGMLGAITARAEAHVRRIACIYALLDQQAHVDVPHLKAALALWEYAENSCRYIFGDSIGDKKADQILQALRYAPDGMLTRTQISDLLQHNVPSAELSTKLAALAEGGFAEVITVEQDGPGRPAEYWKSKDSGTSDYQRFFDHQPEGYRGNERNEEIENPPEQKPQESGELLSVRSSSNFDPESPKANRVEVD